MPWGGPPAARWQHCSAASATALPAGRSPCNMLQHAPVLLASSSWLPMRIHCLLRSWHTVQPRNGSLLCGCIHSPSALACRLCAAADLLPCPVLPMGLLQLMVLLPS